MSELKQYDQRKATGSHFTPPELARFVAGRMLNHFDIDGQRDVRVLDPACGDGELLATFAKSVSALIRGRLILIGIDSNASVVEEAKERLQKLPVKRVEIRHGIFLDISLRSCGQVDFFDEAKKLESVHVIIANPPYVRTQVLGANRAQQLASAFQLNGRIDLYQAFLVAMTQELRPGGILGVITSNRFLSTKSGASTRKFLASNFDIEEIFDLGDTKLFEAAVLPAILIGRKKSKNRHHHQAQNRFVRIYEAVTESATPYPEEDIFSILDRTKSGVYKSSGRFYNVSSGILSIPANLSDVWSLIDSSEKEWVERIEAHAYCRVGDLVDVRVGIKTTADSVFIRPSWDDLEVESRPEPEIIRRLLTPDDARKWRPMMNHRKKKYVLYTHIIDTAGRRRAIKLTNYPRAAKYLESNRAKLESRKYVIEAGRNWYEIWVPQDPAAWSMPKIVWPDIRSEPLFFYEDSGCIVKGNCYWISLREKQHEDLLFLIQGVANTKLMTQYHDLVFNNKLYAGRRRYLTQYVAKYPLPNPSSESAKQIISLVKELVFQKLEQTAREQKEMEIEAALANAFGVELVISERNHPEEESEVCH
ncbi:N-6 DNA methylase [bacterium]|nr:N-6 DNA methylase [bacterium]